MRRLAGNALLVLGGDLAARALGFAATVWLAAVFGRDGYGLVTVGMTYLSYVLWFADLGLGTLGAREMGHPPEERHHTPGEILAARVLLSLLVLPLAVGLAWVLYPESATRTVVLGYLLTAIPYGFLLEWYFQGVRSYAPLLLSRTLTAGVYLLGLHLFVTRPEDIDRVPLTYAAGYLVAALLLLGLFLRRESSPVRGLTLARIRATLRRAGSIGAGSILAQSVQLLPPLVLGFISIDQTGVLGAAVRIAFLLLIADRAVGSLYLPRMSGLLHTDRPRALRLAGSTMRLALAIAAAIVAGTVIGAEEAVAVVYPGEFADAELPLVLLAIFVALTLANSVGTYSLLAGRRDREWLRATAVAAVGTGALALLLTVVLRLGATGGALAMIGGELILTLMTLAAMRRDLAIPLLLPTLHALALGAVVGGGVWLAGVRGVAAGLGVALLVLILAFASRLLDGGVRDLLGESR